MAAMPLLLLFLTATMRGQSALDGFDPDANDKIRVVFVQPDGKVLIGGDFTSLSPNGGAAVTRNHIARLNPDGTLDTAFNPNANGIVESFAVQADGKILVGGIFTSIGGQPRNRLARLDPTTGLADSFDPNANNSVRSIVVQADGKVLASGAFTSIGGQFRNRIARLDPATGLADSFNPDANDFVFSIALQKDGKIVAGGLFTSIGGEPRNRIARLDPATGLADSFNPNANHLINSVVVQADGKILAGGAFSGANSIGGQMRNHIARLDPTTGLADSFDPNISSAVLSMAVQADGKILAGGNFATVGGQPRASLARLDPITGLADSFAPNPSNNVFSIAVQADGKIVAGGDFTTLTPSGGALVTRHGIARLETDGRVDQTLDLNIVGDSVDAIAVQPDGKVLIGGTFTSVLGVPRNNIARLNTDGTLDTAFDTNVNHTGGFPGVYAIALQTDGKVLVGGRFSSVGGQARNNIARLDATTGLADSFNPNANDDVRAIALQADGKILAGGRFNGLNSIGGQTRNFIVRLDPTTGLPDSFDPDANSIVMSILVQADGKILVGGNFSDVFADPTTIGGQRRNYMARLDPTTGLADLFNPESNGIPYAMAIQADGKILTGGSFLMIGGQSRHRMARLDPASALADSFDPDPIEPNGAGIFSIAVQADRKILAAGRFNAIGGQTRRGIARLDATTGLADSFNPDASDPSDFTYSYAIALQADGKILVGGFFSSIGGQPRHRFARLSNDTAALQNLAATPNTITLTRGGSCQQFTRVTFESSTDNVNYTPLGSGTAAGSNWTLTGLSLPIEQNIYIRARGYYGSGRQNGSESISESVRNVFLPPPGTLGNISTRVRVQTGDNAMIGGFIITGTEPKTVIVRGIGPSLPLAGALADPIIEVHGSSGEILATNDNWRDGLYADQVAATLPPTNDLESALYGTINPGAYTVVVRGTNNTTGIGLFEVYDLDPTADSKLANISTRGFVETGDNVLIGGLIVIGQNPLRAIVRAIGPSLPVPGALEDPILELYDANGGLIAINYNWRDDQEAEILATGIPPSNELEAAIVRDFTPGNYTAIVRGLNNTTGTALVEAYDLN